jgi:hypothetical protein
MVNGRRLAELAAHHAIADEFLSTFKRNEHIEPEKALLERLLTDAVDCYKKHFHSDSRVGRRRFREAKKWIFSSRTDWIFSFNSVCQLLDVDPDFIRRQLRRPAHASGRQRTVTIEEG